MYKEYIGKSININLDVKTYDIDVAGHVNNIVCIRWLEDMRAKLFAEIYPLQKLLEINFYPVVTSTETKYKKLINLFDKPVGTMVLDCYSHGMIILSAEIKVNNFTVFTAIQKCVLMDLTNNKMFNGSIEDLIKETECHAI